MSKLRSVDSITGLGGTLDLSTSTATFAGDTLIDQTALDAAIAGKQDTLTAGTFITIGAGSDTPIVVTSTSSDPTLQVVGTSLSSWGKVNFQLDDIQMSPVPLVGDTVAITDNAANVWSFEVGTINNFTNAIELVPASEPAINGSTSGSNDLATFSDLTDVAPNSITFVKDGGGGDIDVVTGTIAAGSATAVPTALDTKTVTDAIAGDVTTLDGEAVKKDGSVAMTGELTVVDGTVATSAVSKGQLDSATSGLGAFWTPVDVDGGASNLTLSGEQTLDGVLTSTSRVMVRGQTADEDNGIYVTAAGAWSRATDADADAEFKNNKTVSILSGTTSSGSVYAYTGSDDPVVGTDTITFTFKNGAADIADGSITEAKLSTSVNASLDLADSALQDGDTLDATDLSGAVPDASISESSVTQHEAALTITVSQISDINTLEHDNTYASYVNPTSSTQTVKASSSDLIWGIKVFVSGSLTGTVEVGDSGDTDRLSNGTIDLSVNDLTVVNLPYRYTTTNIDAVFSSITGTGTVDIVLLHEGS